MNDGPPEVLRALYLEWCLLTQYLWQLCRIRETHSAPRTISITPILANHRNGFYHRTAHLPRLQQILKVENILYNRQYSFPDLLPISFSHSHLFTKCRGSIWELTVTYISHSGFKKHVSMAPNTHSQMAKLDQLSSGKCLCFHINLSLLCSFLLLYDFIS